MFTQEQLGKRNRKVRTFDEKVDAVMAQMRAGALLQLSFDGNAPAWRLSSGAGVVPPAIARAVVACKNIISCNDCLFPQTLSQTWKWRT